MRSLLIASVLLSSIVHADISVNGYADIGVSNSGYMESEEYLDGVALSISGFKNDVVGGITAGDQGVDHYFIGKLVGKASVTYGKQTTAFEMFSGTDIAQGTNSLSNMSYEGRGSQKDSVKVFYDDGILSGALSVNALREPKRVSGGIGYKLADEMYLKGAISHDAVILSAELTEGRLYNQIALERIKKENIVHLNTKLSINSTHAIYASLSSGKYNSAGYLYSHTDYLKMRIEVQDPSGYTARVLYEF